MAGPDPPLAHPGRRAAADDRGGQPARRDLQPGDLREGDPRLARLRRPDRGARARGLPGARDLPGDRHPGRAGGGRRAATGVRRARRLRRLRLARGRSGPGVRQRPHAGAGAGVLGAGRPAQRDDQDPRHDGVPAGDRAGDLRGHQHQRHAAVLGRGLHDRRRGLHQGPGAPPRRGAGPRHPLRRLVLRLAGGLRGRQAPRGRSAAATCRAGRRSPTRAPPTGASRSSSMAIASPSCARPAPTSSGRCGPRRA